MIPTYTKKKTKQTEKLWKHIGAYACCDLTYQESWNGMAIFILH